MVEDVTRGITAIRSSIHPYLSRNTYKDQNKGCEGELLDVVGDQGGPLPNAVTYINNSSICMMILNCEVNF